MPSSVTPPVDDNVASLFLSDTFYTWFNVSNDMVNKINPIEVYSITADTANYLSGSQKDGILITDNGNGNYNIGLQLPANITGGITWHGDHVFNAGISGHIVNNVNGRTGAVDAIQTISGRTAEFSGFTGNVPSAVFSINGVTATATGGMTLQSSDISGIATTGGIGTILAATGGGTGPYDKRVAFFNATPEEDQTAIRIAGSTGINAKVKFGSNSVHADNARLFIDQGGLSFGVMTSNDVDVGPDYFMTERGHIASGNHMNLLAGISSGGAMSGTFAPHVFRFGNNQTRSSGATFGVMTELFSTRIDGINLSNKVYAQGNAAGAAGKVLASDANDKAVWGTLFSTVSDADGGGTNLFVFTSNSNRAVDSDFPGTRRVWSSTFDGSTAGTCVQQTLPSGGTYLVCGFVMGSSDAGGEDDNFEFFNSCHTTVLNGGDNVRTWFISRGADTDGSIAGSYGAVESDNHMGFGLAFKLT